MDVVILHAELSVAMGNQPIYVVTIDEPRFVDETAGGARGVTAKIMPAEVFESHAAEYDIDVTKPGGWDDLIDLVFGGTHTGTTESVNEQLNDPDFLYNAPTVAHARKARLDKIRKARGTSKVRGETGHAQSKALLGDVQGIANSGAEDPLEFIKRTAPMSSEHVKVKQEFTRRRRNLIRARRAGRNPVVLSSDLEAVDQQVKTDMGMPTRESAEVLAQRLLGDLPDGVTPESKVPARERPPSNYQ